MSTPVHFHSHSIRSRKSSRARRKQGRGHILPTPDPSQIPQLQHAQPHGGYGHRPVRRESERMIMGEGGKPVLRAPGVPVTPPAPPPPPPLPPLGGFSRPRPDRHTPGVRRKGSSSSGGGMSGATRDRHRATARLENLGRAGRQRTPADMREWLNWRVKVNEQLTSYVLKGKEDAGNLQINAFPGNIKDECLNAIFYHAHRQESPETSLDNLSYITYGLPRVRLTHGQQPHMEDTGSVSDQPPVDYDQESSDGERPARSNLRSRPSLLRRTAIEEIERNLRSKLRRNRSPMLGGRKGQGAKKSSGGGDYQDPRVMLGSGGSSSQPAPVSDHTPVSPILRGNVRDFRPPPPLLCGPRPPVPGGVPTVLCSLTDIRRPRLSPRGKVGGQGSRPCFQLPTRPANHFGPVFRAPIPPSQRLILNRTPGDRVGGHVNPIYEQPGRLRPVQAGRTNNVDYRSVLKRNNSESAQLRK